MAFIGENDETGLAGATQNAATTNQTLMSGFGTYSPASSEEVFRLGFFSHGTLGGNVEVFVADITVDPDNAPIILSGTITLGASAGWYTLAITPVALTTGNTYAVGYRVVDTIQPRRRFVTANSIRFNTLFGTDPLPATFVGTAGSSAQYGMYAETQAATATPNIDSHDDPIRLDSTSNHTVSGYAATIDSGNVSAGGVTLNATSANDTTANWPALAQNLAIPEPAASGLTLELEALAESATDGTGFQPPTGWTYENVTTIAAGLTAKDWGYNVPLENTVDGKITNDSENSIATHNPDGSTIWHQYGTVQLFSRDENQVIGVKGGLTEINLTNSNADTTPDPFTFNNVSGVALSTASESNIVTITGIDAPSPISIDAGEYRVDGGAWTSVAGTISNNQTAQMRITSSASYSTAVNQTLTIGGVSDGRSVTTIAEPPTGGVSDRLGAVKSIVSPIVKNIFQTGVK